MTISYSFDSFDGKIAKRCEPPRNTFDSYTQKARPDKRPDKRFHENKTHTASKRTKLKTKKQHHNSMAE